MFASRSDVNIAASDRRSGYTMTAFAGYGAEHEQTMRLCWASLPADHRRRDVSVDLMSIGRGGISYVAAVLIPY